VFALDAPGGFKPLQRQQVCFFAAACMRSRVSYDFSYQHILPGLK
jgi:hypothetical protein